MVTIGMNYTVLPGKEDVFERAFHQVLAVMQSTSGHTRSRLYKDVDKPNVYLIVSEWSDRAQFDTFIRSEAFARVTNWGKEQVLSTRPSHQVYHNA